MGQTIADFTNAMKENYGPGWRNSVNNSNVIWAEATKNERDIVGLEAVWSLHSGRSSASGTAAEGGTLPTPDKQRHLKARQDLTYQYHTIKLTGPVKHLTKGSEGAFASALEIEVKQGEKDMTNNLARQTVGDVVSLNSVFYTGTIGGATTAKGTNDFTLGNASASEMRHFFVGMVIDSITAATAAVSEAAMVITAIDVATRVITVDDTGAMISTDYVCRSGSLGEDLTGLRALLSSSTTYDYAGVDTSASGGVWLAQQSGATTTPISETIFEEAGELVETDGDGSSADDKVYFVEHSQRRKLASLLQARKQYDGREMVLPSGWKGVSLSRGTLVADRYVPTTYAFGVHRPELQKFVGLDFQWDQDDSQIFFKDPTTDSIQARFKGYVQLAATNRNSHVQIRLAAPTF